MGNFISPLSITVGLVLLYLLNRLFSRRSSARLPPGPKPKPIIGNLGDLPSPGQQDWVHWGKFKDLYGPISSITILGQTIVIINDARIAFDLLEKRSNIYSSRPRMTFAGEMCPLPLDELKGSIGNVHRVGWNDSLAMQTYSDTFRAYRKAMHRVLGTKNAVAQFNDLQDVEVRRFLLRVLERPGDLIQHIRTEAGAVILKIAYGYNINPHGPDPLFALASESLENFSAAATPGAWLVDTIPLLKYLPTWFPGAGFKQTAAVWRKTLMSTMEKPYQLVLRQMEEGNYPDSYLSNLLEESRARTLTAEEQHVIKWTAGSLYAGGADTTVSAVSCFFLAMALYPEVQKNAQEELDRVLGPNNLPTFEDRSRLPYIEAVVKESLRWHPVGPMGIPHTCTEDDTYDGYHIPKGSLIMTNIWNFTHDEASYKDPEIFNPGRFLGESPELDPHTIAFGFGRRICPGRLLADSTIFLSIAQSLAVFDVRKDGENSARAEFLPGVISHPVPFKLKITPRSKAHEELIRAVEIEHPWEESHAGDIEGIVC
ncbi:cytochrome P450 [Aspergillus lucknowensis]|uniref:Cytochrome P450 n=1 Tax=Aspergillus lucknowensis TaxID=176173 RepID=A0ABR4M3N1_9EURO